MISKSNTSSTPSFFTPSQCFLLSFALHLLLLFLLYFHPWILKTQSSPFRLSSLPIEQLDEDIENGEFQTKSLLLRQVFQQIALLSNQHHPFFDLPELRQGVALAPKWEEDTLPFNLPQVLLPSLKETLAFSLSSPVMNSVPEEESFPFIPGEVEKISFDQPLSSQPPLATVYSQPFLFSPVYKPQDENPLHAEESSASASVEQLSPLSPPSFLVMKGELIPAHSIKKIPQKKIGIEQETFFPPLFTHSEGEPQKEEHLDLPVDLERYHFPDEIASERWDLDFNVTMNFLPNPEGTGYIFSLAVSPSEKLQCETLKQNFYFVLDRSSAVQKHRFAVFKRAILKALASMQSTDTFNVFVLGQKIARFKPQNSSPSSKMIRAVEEFLEKQEVNSFFHSGELYSSLEKFLPWIPDDDEMHTIILLTNGKTNLSTEKKQKALNKWVRSNHSRVSLYAAAIGKENDLVTLDLLSNNSGGKLLYSDTHAAFPRKLAKLILDLKDPIAKHLTLKAVPSDPNAHITFQTPFSAISTLYRHQPYTIYGEIDTPCSFDFLLEGRHRDTWVGIKKLVSFSDGKKGDRSLESNWGAQRANLYYDKFLEEGKKVHLKIAGELLKKSRTDMAFD